MKKIGNISDLPLSQGATILAIMPHPDDETGFTAGFLTRGAHAGFSVSLLCITDGAKSTLRYGLGEEDSLAQVRREELKNAAKALGVNLIVCSKFPDGEITNQHDAIYHYVDEKIKEYEPSAVVTLEPDGCYGHPDHITLSKIVTDIYDASHSFLLIYATVGKEFHPDDGSKRMAQKKIHPITPNAYMVLSLKEQLAKIRAIRAHKSQFSKNPSFRPSIQTYKMIMREYFFIVPFSQSLP